jgi:hypothetical protein
MRNRMIYRYAPPLSDTVDKVLVLYHDRKPEQLIGFLESGGFSVEGIKSEGVEEFPGYSRSALALMAHMKAWEKAGRYERAMVCEYDFIPCAGFGSLPSPFDPDERNMGICWLYTTGPRFYGLRPAVSGSGRTAYYMQGGSTSMVSYVITSESSGMLLDDFRTYFDRHGAERYTPWDSSVDRKLIKRNRINFVPFRNYGEHGMPLNPEHLKEVRRAWDHRADVLAGPLAFSPYYAPRYSLRYLYTRAGAFLRGFARLVTFRLVSIRVISRTSYPLRLIAMSVLRFFGRIF